MKYNFIQVFCSTQDANRKLLTQMHFLDMPEMSEMKERDSCCVIIL